MIQRITKWKLSLRKGSDWEKLSRVQQINKSFLNIAETVWYISRGVSIRETSDWGRQSDKESLIYSCGLVTLAGVLEIFVLYAFSSYNFRPINLWLSCTIRGHKISNKRGDK